MGTSHDQQRDSVTGLVIGVGLPVAGWFAIGPDRVVFAVAVQGGFLFMALLVGPALVDVRRSRYRVRTAEVQLYTFLGAEPVRRILDLVGWNRLIGHLRASEDGVSMLARSLGGTEQSETAHLVGATATAGVAVVAATTAHPLGSAQTVLVGFVLHGYPVMIQRIVRFRITSRRTGLNR